ncbi:MAG: AAA family ATPase, partial [Coriobacteriales bacterium]|nr:AAA family ATPase [Coriobacteriales bacterium]
MYLKSLTLKGFKSFASSSTLKFEPGMNVVVGPNGSGKSNISDAILWVLGTQSPKILRGENMQDVIFAGSKSKGAVNLAQVDLSLDNSDKTIDLDFEEIIITRKVFRNGENQYLLNGTPVRLNDILDVLSDTKIGRDSHAVISQGSLAQYISAKPENRRLLIEEAAGTLKHKKRKEKSLRKLEKMQTQLTRVEDVKREIIRNLRPIAKQAKVAKEYSELKSSFDKYQIWLAVNELKEMQAVYEEKKSQEKELIALIDLCKLQLNEKNETLNKYQKSLEEKGVYSGDLNALQMRTQSALEKFSSLNVILKEKINNTKAIIESLDSEILAATTKNNELKLQISSNKEKFQEKNANLSSYSEQLIHAKEELDKTKEIRQNLDEQIANLNKQNLDLESNVEIDTNVLNESIEKSSTNSSKNNMFTLQLEQANKNLSNIDENINNKNNQIKQSEEQLTKLDETLEGKNQQFAQLNQKLDKLNENIVGDTKIIADLNSKLAALNATSESFKSAAFNPQLKDKIKSGKNFIGNLYDIIDCDKAYFKIIENLLDYRLF